MPAFRVDIEVTANVTVDALTQEEARDFFEEMGLSELWHDDWLDNADVAVDVWKDGGKPVFWIRDGKLLHSAPKEEPAEVPAFFADKYTIPMELK